MTWNCECCGNFADVCGCNTAELRMVAYTEGLMDALEIAKKMNSTHDIISALEDMIYGQDESK